MLRRTLGLSSDNQVRNRIERIKDLLSEHVRRGPNNQIFLTDPGLDLMRQLQELYDTGLTMTEASNVLRVHVHRIGSSDFASSPGSMPYDVKPDQSGSSLALALRDEMALIRKHMAALEKQLISPPDARISSADTRPWWTYLREDVDVT
jgi:hypothetical protein